MIHDIIYNYMAVGGIGLGYTVLLVDDDPRLTANLSEFIPWEKLGFSVPLIAHNGEEAISFAANTHIDLVLTDLSMPGIGGLDLIRRMRAFGDRTEFIILSGYGTFDYAREAIELQVKHFLTKPTDLNEVITAVDSIREALDTQHATDYLMNVNSRTLSETLTSALDTLLNDLRNGGNAPSSLKYLLCQVNTRWQAGYYSMLRIRLIASAGEMAEVAAYFHTLFRITAERLSIRYYFVQGDCANQYVLINFDDELLAEMLIEELRKACSSARDFSLVCGMSALCGSPETLAGCFQEADQAVLAAMSKGQPFSCFIRRQPKEEAGDCISRLINADAASQRILLKTMLSSNASADEAIRLLVHIVERLEESHRYPVIPFGQESTDVPYQLPPGDPVREWTLKMIRYLLIDCTVRSESINARVIARAISYIHEHYAMDISLESISRHVNFSPNYFSRIFRETVGIRYIDYITSVRITKSLGMLMQDSIPIYTVSERTGYKNPKYFSQLFSTALGCTPTEFRQKNGA